MSRATEGIGSSPECALLVECSSAANRSHRSRPITTMAARAALWPSSAAVAADLWPSHPRDSRSERDFVRANGRSLRILKHLQRGEFRNSEDFAPAAVSGDGGNRTHVRGRVKGGVYERIRRSDLTLDSPRRRGCREPAPKYVPGLAGANLTEQALLVDPGISAAGRAEAERPLGQLAAKPLRNRGRNCACPHLFFSRVFYEASRDLDSQPPPRADHVEACRPLGVMCPRLIVEARPTTASRRSDSAKRARPQL
jgi:hypothetical protein